MTKRTIHLGAFLVAGSMATAAWAGPPGRPVALTQAQYHRLVSVEQQPQHQAMRAMRASYSSQREREMDFTRASDDFWTVAYQGGLPGTILGLLIAAAPL